MSDLRKAVGEILRPHLHGITGRSWQDCFDDEDNIFFINGDNLAFFEKQKDGVYFGHYFYNTFRGKEAIEYSKEVLNHMFEKAQVIQGLTPVENKAAVWMSHHLGFKSYGVTDSIAGPLRIFILTKQEWRQFNG